MKKSVVILKENWKVFFYLILTYAVLYVLLVRGLSGGLNLSALKSSLNHPKGTSNFSISLTLLGDLIGNSTSTQSSSPSAGVYQAILLLITSLAIIWALRQVYNKTKIRIRDTFYRGMYPLIPFLLVLLLLAVEFIPLLIGASIYATVMSNGIAVGGLEKLIWGIVFVGLSAVSFYMATSTVFALYIVTLPDMTPLKAIRSARGLVKKRRSLVLRKLLFFPLVSVLGTIIIMIPVILLITPLAVWLFLVILTLMLVFVHSYIYALYRELINE